MLNPHTPLLNPFARDHIQGISVTVSRLFAGWVAYGRVDFSRGNTFGSQSFTGNTFDEVAADIARFIKTMENES